MGFLFRIMNNNANHIADGLRGAEAIKEKWNKIREDYLNNNPSKCIECDTVLSYIKRNNTYCSKKCSTKSTNRIRRKYKICINCSTDITGRGGKYCNVNCQHEHKKLSVYKKIESGNTSLSHRWYKKYLIDKYGNKCMKCGWSETNPHSNRVPIELEHIDGKSDNNSLDNLELLCPNCHSLTPTYKALNKGNGRYKRRLRYREEQNRLK